MYSMTTLEGALLGLLVLTTAAALVFGVLVAFPRARRTISATVVCPMAGRRARAELQWDAWTLRCVDVTRCSVLGERAVGLCSKTCLP